MLVFLFDDHLWKSSAIRSFLVSDVGRFNHRLLVGKYESKFIRYPVNSDKYDADRYRRGQYDVRVYEVDVCDCGFDVGGF